MWSAYPSCSSAPVVPSAPVVHGSTTQLFLPARTVVRAVVPPSAGVVAGQDLFGWLHRHHLAVTGPTVEEHLGDADGAHAIVLEIPVSPRQSVHVA